MERRRAGRKEGGLDKRGRAGQRVGGLDGEREGWTERRRKRRHARDKGMSPPPQPPLGVLLSSPSTTL